MSRQITVAVLALLILGGLFITLRPDASNAEPQDVSFDVSITGDTMEPKEFAAREGDTITFRIRADREVELHLHGYDEGVSVTEEVPATLTFEADKTGNWPIEDHETEEQLGRLVVQPQEGG